MGAGRRDGLLPVPGDAYPVVPAVRASVSDEGSHRGGPPTGRDGVGVPGPATTGDRR